MSFFLFLYFIVRFLRSESVIPLAVIIPRIWDAKPVPPGSESTTLQNVMYTVGVPHTKPWPCSKLVVPPYLLIHKYVFFSNIL